MTYGQPLLNIVVSALDDLKGEDVCVLDVRRMTTVTDAMVIVSGTSTRHVRSLARHVVETAKARDFKPLGVEGERYGEWILVDLGDVVVHIMLPQVRAFYNLEKLWSLPEHTSVASAD